METENMEGWSKEQLDALFDKKYRVNGKIDYVKLRADQIKSPSRSMPASVLWERFLKKRPTQTDSDEPI